MSDEVGDLEVDESIRASLRAARDALSLPSARREVLRTRVMTHLVQGTPVMSKVEHDAAAERTLSPTPRAAMAPKTGFSGWTVLGATLVGLGAGLTGGILIGARQEPPPAPVVSAPTEVDTTDEVAPFPASLESAPADGAEAPGVAEETASTESEPSPRTSGSAVVVTSTKKEPERSEASLTFYEELSYLRRAQSALRDGKPTLSLGLMQGLDEIKKDGALLSERRMTKVLALCALGRDDEARSIARILAETGSVDVYKKRLQSSCAGPIEEGE